MPSDVDIDVAVIPLGDGCGAVDSGRLNGVVE